MDFACWLIWVWSVSDGSKVTLSHLSQDLILETESSSIMQQHRKISCLYGWGQDDAPSVRYIRFLGQGSGLVGPLKRQDPPKWLYLILIGVNFRLSSVEYLGDILLYLNTTTTLWSLNSVKAQWFFFTGFCWGYFFPVERQISFALPHPVKCTLTARDWTKVQKMLQSAF